MSRSTEIWEGMPRVEFFEIEEYLQELSVVLRLQDWEIVLVEEYSQNPDCVAEIRVTYDRKTASIRLAEDFMNYDSYEQTHALTHELMHCHFGPQMQLVDETLAKTMGQEAFTIFRGAFVSTIEYATDAAADALAPLVPQLEWEE